MNPNTGDMPAFPGSYQKVTFDEAGDKALTVTFQPPGMTKREWFAGQALTIALIAGMNRADTVSKIDDPDAKQIAQESVRIADALIAELERGE